MASVYIIYSRKWDVFYIGSCLDISQRLEAHNTGKYEGAFTAKANDWELYHEIAELELQQARKIEVHIKKMKSRTYISNLRKYPEISFKLKERFK